MSTEGENSEVCSSILPAFETMTADLMRTVRNMELERERSDAAFAVAIRDRDDALDGACILKIALGVEREQRDSAIKERDAALLDREVMKQNVIDVCDQSVHGYMAIGESNAMEREKLVGDRDSAIKDRDTALATCEGLIQDRAAAIKERDAALDIRDIAIADVDKLGADLNLAIADKANAQQVLRNTIDELNKARAEREEATSDRLILQNKITELGEIRRKLQSERDIANNCYQKAADERDGYRLEYCAIAQHRDAALKELDELIGERNDAIENSEIEKYRFHGLEFSVGVIAAIVGLLAVHFGIAHRKVQPTPFPEPAAVERMSSYIPGYPITCDDVSQHLFVEAEAAGGSMFECRASSAKWTVMLYGGRTPTPGEQFAIPSEDK